MKDTGFPDRPLEMARGRIEADPRAMLNTAVDLLRGPIPGSPGTDVETFERAIANRVGRRHGVAVGSGKAALILALKALRLPPDSEVVLPAFLVPEVVAVILGTGLRPRIVDVDPRTFNLDPAAVAAAARPTVRVVLPVHLFGTPCDIAAIQEVSRQCGAVVIEDAAQALGAEIGGRAAGSFGRMSYFSFGVFKNLNTLLGGMILTDDDDLARDLRVLQRALRPPNRRELAEAWMHWLALGAATHPVTFRGIVGPVVSAMERLSAGWSRRAALKPPAEYRTPSIDVSKFMVGFSDVQARLGLTMLPRLDPAAAVRVRNADSLDRSLAGIPGVATQAVPAGGRSIRWNYPMLIPDRDRVLPDVRRASGFDLAPGYTPDLSAIPAFREYSCPCPVAARADATHVYVPVHPDLAPGTFEAAADRLANVLRAVT